MHDTFWTLLSDRAHWEFEIFLMLLFDGIILGVCWPFARKHWLHHIARDRRENNYYSMSTEAFACGRYPADELCVKCEGKAVVLDTSVVMCKECGHVTVPSKGSNGEGYDA